MEDFAAVCTDLEHGHYCFRCTELGNANFLLHEHISSQRISKDDAIATLRSLLALASGWSAPNILHSNLNKRRGDPPAVPTIGSRIDHSVPGVVRYFVHSANASAGFDLRFKKSSLRT